MRSRGKATPERSKRRPADSKKHVDASNIFPTRMKCFVKLRPTDWPRLVIDAEYCLTGDRVFIMPNMKALEDRMTNVILDFLSEQDGATKGGAE